MLSQAWKKKSHSEMSEANLKESPNQQFIHKNQEYDGT